MVFCKEQILEKIDNSKNGFGLLGVVNADLDLLADKIGDKSLISILSNKFSSIPGYTIDIVAKSLPQLAKMSQMSYEKSALKVSSDYNNQNNIIRVMPLGLLGPKKDELSDKIRASFKGLPNIEPTEDVCRAQLDLVYYENFINNVVLELCGNKNTDITVREIEKLFLDNLRKTVVAAVRKSKDYQYFFQRYMIEDLQKIETQVSIQLDKFFASVCGSNTISKIFDTINSKLSKGFKFVFLNLSEQNRSQVSISLKPKNCIDALSESALSYLYKADAKNYCQIRDNAAYKATEAREKKLNELKENPDYVQRLHIKIFCDDIYLQIIRVDDEYFVVNENGEFIQTTSEDDILYYENCMSNPNVAEITQKGNKDEVVPCYIEIVQPDDSANKEIKADKCNRLCVGQRARDSFYFEKNQTMQFVKNVTWALVFDRNGNILLHKRGINAKDNQDLWDKSVGGHISVNDPNSIYGARREIIEELYTIEGAEQSHSESSGSTDFSEKNPEKIIFLGQWEEKHYPKFKDFLSDKESLKLNDDEFYCFKYEFSLVNNVLISKRKLPSGKELFANCFVDLFFVITSKKFETGGLKNSKYIVKSPSEIKQYYRTGILPKEGEREEGRFDVTPDLEALLTHAVWDNQITIFSKSVKDAFGK